MGVQFPLAAHKKTNIIKNMGVESYSEAAARAVPTPNTKDIRPPKAGAPDIDAEWATALYHSRRRGKSPFAVWTGRINRGRAKKRKRAIARKE
jgi:hypothetical protein